MAGAGAVSTGNDFRGLKVNSSQQRVLIGQGTCCTLVTDWVLYSLALSAWWPWPLGRMHNGDIEMSSTCCPQLHALLFHLMCFPLKGDGLHGCWASCVLLRLQYIADIVDCNHVCRLACYHTALTPAGALVWRQGERLGAQIALGCVAGCGAGDCV